MASRFVENLDEVPITHPHLNVSLDDILAEESRKRSTSQKARLTDLGVTRHRVQLPAKAK
jgi:hypothetical protein